MASAPHSITMDDQSMFSNSHQYGGDDDRSMGTHSSIGMASLAKAHSNETFTAKDQFNTATQDGATTATTTAADGLVETTEDALTAEAMNAVSKERARLYKENTNKLQSILENIKNSTKHILNEMDGYLKETEEVEKTFIRCRANTQKESQRMEQVEPDVIAATQRFMAQGAQLFGGAGGPMNFMNMAALMNGAGGGASMGMSNAAPGAQNGNGTLMGMATVTPRGSDAVSISGSMAGSSMAGSMN